MALDEGVPAIEKRLHGTWTTRRIRSSEQVEVGEELHRLAVVGRLVTGLAHDLRNYSVKQRGFVQHIEKLLNRRQLEDVLPFIPLLLQSSMGVTSLTEEILDFGSGKHQRRKRVELSAIIHFVEMMVRSTFKEVRLQIENKLPHQMIDVNVVQLEQVFMNLLQNAAQVLSQEEGLEGRHPCVNLIVHPLCRTSDLELLGGQVSDQKYVGISVVDNGIGMDDAVLERIATPFYTTRESRGGTGIGLYMCSYILEAHGGALLVRSRKGEGSSFTVCLPIR